MKRRVHKSGVLRIGRFHDVDLGMMLSDLLRSQVFVGFVLEIQSWHNKNTVVLMMIFWMFKKTSCLVSINFQNICLVLTFPVMDVFYSESCWKPLGVLNASSLVGLCLSLWSSQRKSWRLMFVFQNIVVNLFEPRSHCFCLVDQKSK